MKSLIANWAVVDMILHGSSPGSGYCYQDNTYVKLCQFNLKREVNPLDALDVVPGYKTYLVVLIGIVVNVLVQQDIISIESLGLVNTVLAYLGLGTVRMAVSR